MGHPVFETYLINKTKFDVSFFTVQIFLSKDRKESLFVCLERYCWSQYWSIKTQVTKLKIVEYNFLRCAYIIDFKLPRQYHLMACI